MTEEVSNKEFYNIEFENQDQYFYISQSFSSSSKWERVDTEEAKVENIKMEGHQGFYVEVEDRQAIYLDMGNLSVVIYGNIGKKELIRMARNLELLEK